MSDIGKMIQDGVDDPFPHLWPRSKRPKKEWLPEDFVDERFEKLEARIAALEAVPKAPPETPMTTGNSFYMGNGVWARYKP